MLWIVAVIVALLILSGLGKRSSGRKAKLDLSPPSFKRHTPEEAVFATELVEGRHEPRTREQVESMFAGARAELPKIRAASRAATKAAERFASAAAEGRHAPVSDLSVFELNLAKTRFIIAECSRACDCLFFTKDGDSARYFDLVDRLDTEEGELAEALEDITYTQADIAAGEYDAPPPSAAR